MPLHPKFRSCECLWNILPLGISCCITMSKLSRAHLGRTKAFTVKLLIFPPAKVFKISVKRLKYYEVCLRWLIKFHVFDFCVEHGVPSTCFFFPTSEQNSFLGSHTLPKTRPCCQVRAFVYFLMRNWEEKKQQHFMAFKKWESESSERTLQIPQGWKKKKKNALASHYVNLK